MISGIDLENAARMYCKLLGEDPDEQVVATDFIGGVPVGWEPLWKARCPDIRRAHAAQIAVREHYCVDYREG